jgi:hypothetical protein
MNKSPDSYLPPSSSGGLEMTPRMDTSRALVAGLLWAGVTAAMSGGANLQSSALGGGLMGAAVLANGFIHSGLGLFPTMTSSALATGASFAGLQMLVRGDNNMVVNVVAGGVTDVATEYVGGMMGYGAPASSDDTTDDSE